MNMKHLFSVLFMAAMMFASAKSAIAAEEPASDSYSLQDLLVTPTRVVFEGDRRTTELALVNRSNKTHAYAISFVQCRMTETGDIKEIGKDAIANPDEHFADSLVRFSPRRVTLEPRQAQMVRMQLRKPADLAEGEYRSHLSFRLIPSAEEAVKPDSASRGIQIRLVPIYGVSIPVIVRQGSLAATARMSALHLDSKGIQGKPALSMTIEREGARSTYGDVDVFWKASGSKLLTVALVKGVAVYTPNTKRTMLLTLSPPVGTDLRGGQLIVRYINRENGTEQVIAENQLTVP